MPFLSHQMVLISISYGRTTMFFAFSVSRARIAFLLLFVIILTTNGMPQGHQPKLDVPFEPTHPSVVDAMLELAKVSPGDVVYDLGCGDGRILVRAAEKWGVAGVGVDIDPQRIKEANENAVNSGTADKVHFMVGDIMQFDFSRATVVMLYLLERINIQLRPKLIQQLKPGTRVVSHAFDMGIWEPDSIIYHSKARNKRLFLWVIPAAVGGTWRWSTAGEKTPCTLHFNQAFQGVTYGLKPFHRDPQSVGEILLRGRDLRFWADVTVGGKLVKTSYSGRIENGEIRGVQKREDGGDTFPWIATRLSVPFEGTWMVQSPSSQSAAQPFKMEIRQAPDGALRMTYITGEQTHSDFAHYIWGASILFEINGHTYAGFLHDDFITGKITSAELTHDLSWSARRVLDE